MNFNVNQSLLEFPKESRACFPQCPWLWIATEVQGIQKRKSSCWHWREFLSCRRRKNFRFEESGRRFLHRIGIKSNCTLWRGTVFYSSQKCRGEGTWQKYTHLTFFLQQESFIRLYLCQIGLLTHCEMIDFAVSSWWRSSWKSGPDPNWAAVEMEMCPSEAALVCWPPHPWTRESSQRFEVLTMTCQSTRNMKQVTKTPVGWWF